ncbi:DDB1- and CUL4-associated factor 5-like, partial [Oncorhynchus masou masou]|uniref:DDB1- and CUL4-associated factor 5-like n=1 Tax=Oncorhynchus masou masou TaxID=90313 RepID=UPI0031844DC4
VVFLQYILSGSDDFNLYMWRIPKDPEAGGPGRVVNGASMVLKGHRSIVNQVRFNPSTYMICSSGVEKVIKAWSPYQQTESLGDLDSRVEDKSRSLYSHEEYINLVLNSGSGLSHDYVSQSIQEDPRMMAFFDSLVRREIEGWSSDSDSDLSEGAILQLHARGQRSTRAVGDGAGVLVGSGVATPVPPSAAATADSDHSSSSSLAAPDGAEHPEGVEPLQPRRRGSRFQQSVFLLDLVGEDSDSSGFWPDPMPRPRSPSPRDNSTLSSPTSSPAGASSSSSSSTSSTSSEDEEQRRASRRQRTAARWRRMHFPRLSSGGAPRVRPGLVPRGGVDSCSYPKISIDEASSSSASSTELQQDQDSVQIGPHRSGSKTGRRKTHTLPGSSPAVSLDSQDDRAEQEGLLIASLLSQDALQQRNESRAGRVGERRAALERMAEGLDSPEEADESDHSHWISPSSRHHSPGLNGLQHLDMTEVPVGCRGRLAPDLFESSDSEEERETLELKSAGTRTLVEEEEAEEGGSSSSQRGQAQGALKRTHLGSRGQGSGEGSGGSETSEKKFKT